MQDVRIAPEAEGMLKGLPQSGEFHQRLMAA
jgi:hypothetical protein